MAEHVQCRLLGRIVYDIGILEAVGLVCGCFPTKLPSCPNCQFAVGWGGGFWGSGFLGLRGLGFQSWRLVLSPDFV